MRLFLTLIICLIYATGFAQTQTQMNKDAADAYKKADQELNDVYKKMLTAYKSDVLFIKNLKTSQRIWIAFRDAELKMEYPDREPGYYGSIHPVCVAMFLEQITTERIKILKVWLDGVAEGDACNGSVKIKHQ